MNIEPPDLFGQTIIFMRDKQRNELFLTVETTLNWSAHLERCPEILWTSTDDRLPLLSPPCKQTIIASVHIITDWQTSSL